MTSEPLALTVRRASREYSISREILAQAIQAGELPARQGRRRYMILRSDLERWIRGAPATSAAQAHAERVVRDLEQRETKSPTAKDAARR